tara:strand:- start:259 stop:447 length:189 start_codon:yes stop_codon:yes gene_type:complete
MDIKTLIIEPSEIVYLCTVCITDNNGGKIALTIIVSALILLGLGNWAWKKYFSNKKEISQEK